MPDDYETLARFWGATPPRVAPRADVTASPLPGDFVAPAAITASEAHWSKQTAHDLPRHAAIAPVNQAPWMHIDADPENWDLPEPIKMKFIDVRQEADDASAVLNPLLDERREQISGRMQARARQAQLRRDFIHLSDDHPAYAECEQKIARTDREIARLDDAIKVRGERSSRLRSVADRCERYLRDNAGALFQMKVHAEPSPSLRKAEAPADAVERVRRRVRGLKADKDAVIAAPWPSALALSRAREELEKLADEGRPSCHAMIEDTEATIGWRGRAAHDVTVADRLITNWGPPNAFLAFAWLHREALLAAIEKEILAAADDEHALDAAQRAEKLAEIKGDLLGSEHEEEALVMMAQMAGSDILRRSDADPRAVLGIDGPEPRD